MSNASTINIDIKVDDKGAISTVKKFGNEIESANGKADKSFRSAAQSGDIFDRGIKQVVKSAAAYTIGFLAVENAVGGVINEFKRGLSSIEDFNLTVAASAAYITTFSKQAQSGDLAGGFAAANEYAGQLATKLEMIDSQTIASGKDLQVMSETFIQHGVLLDINNQKQVDGYTNIATALALVTAGQNKDIQMRQEINALLMGQIRATDRLPKLLQNIDPHLKEHLELWKKEGTLIENVGELLKGFSASTGDLDNLWATVGSTMETIHNRVLRGAFKPIFEDLIGLAKDLNASLMDAEGNLTPLARQIQDDIAGAYETARDAIREYGGEAATAAGLLLSAKVAQLAFNAAINASPYMKAVFALGVLNEGLKGYNLNIGKLTESSQGAATSIGNVVDVMKGIRDADTGEVLSKQEQNLRKIADLEQQLSGEKKWWQKSLFPDPAEEARKADEIIGKINELKAENESLSLAETDLQRERMRAGGEYKAQVIELTSTVEAESEKAVNAQIRDAERLADERARLAERVTDALAKEGMTQTEQAVYELKKQYEADLKLAGDDIKLAKMVTEAYQIELKKRTKADNDWAAFSAKQHLAAAEKIKDGWQVAAEGREEADRIANERIEEQNLETTSIITEEWGRAMDSIQSYTVDLVMGAEFSFDTILDIFERMLAEMLVAIVASGIKQAFLNMFDTNPTTTMWNGFTSGMGRAAGFGGGGYGSFSGNENVAGAAGATSGWGKVGGGLMVAGGAYGMYSGAQNLKKGNVGAGALQLGLGGLSAYQGAVTLGIIEKGAATGAAKALGAKLGYGAATTASGASATGAFMASKGAGMTYGSLNAAEAAYLGGKGAAAASTTTTAGASGASGAAASMAAAAPYAVAAVAAFLVGKGIIDKGNRPSASAEIDEFGITPAHLREFTDQVSATNGSILAAVPTLQKYTQAIYDTETQVLTLTNGTKELQLQYDAADQAGHQWSSTITGGTSIMTSAAAEIISSFAPLPLTVDQVHEASMLAGQAFSHMANESELAGRSMNILERYLEDLGMSEEKAATAAQMLIDNVQDLGAVSAGTAGIIAGSASQISQAWRALESMSSENHSDSFSSHLVGGSGQPSFHADGGVFNYGVFTKATRFGRDVFGEAGAEAAVPLHNGPDTLKYMDGKLDQILSGNRQPIIIENIVEIAGREIKRELVPMIDEHVAAKASRGQLANRTAYAAG